MTLEKYRVAFEALTQIAAGSTNPQGVASDAIQVCLDMGDTPADLNYLGRRFRYVGGFNGPEECALWDGKKMWIIYKNPLRARRDVSDSYSISLVESMVARGDWEEITSAP